MVSFMPYARHMATAEKHALVRMQRAGEAGEAVHCGIITGIFHAKIP